MLEIVIYLKRFNYFQLAVGSFLYFVKMAEKSSVRIRSRKEVVEEFACESDEREGLRRSQNPPEQSSVLRSCPSSSEDDAQCINCLIK
jgi:hypothetical protein